MSKPWADLAPAWWQVGPTWAQIFDTPPPFVPNVRCTIRGTEVTPLLDTDVIVRRGRDTVYQPTNAGYASFDFVDLDAIPLRVGDPVVITLDNFAQNPIVVFTGKVSDFQRRMTVFSDVDPEIVVSVQAIGPLADVARRVVLFDGRPSELDGERVLATLQEAAPDAVDPDLVDDGLFEILPLPARENGYDPLSVIQETSFSAEGILFETPDGRIGYADGDRRLLTFDAQVVDIPLAVTNVNRFVVTSQLADLINDVVVEFGEDEAVALSSPGSIDRFGPFDRTFRTVLLNQTNAEALANEILDRQDEPTLQLSEIGIGLQFVDGPLLEELLTLGTCGCTDAIRVEGIPSLLGITDFEGFVEGIEWRLNRRSGEMRLLVSDAALSIGAIRFSAVDEAVTWDDVPPTLLWQNARRIT